MNKNLIHDNQFRYQIDISTMHATAPLTRRNA